MIWNKKRKVDAPVAAWAEAQIERPKSAEELARERHIAECSALCCAASGESVCVRILLGTAAEAARLREMGLCEGAPVQVLRHGNPMVVRVADCRLGLAHALAERVLVVPAEAKSVDLSSSLA